MAVALLTTLRRERELTPAEDAALRELLSAAFPTAAMFATQRWVYARPEREDLWFLTRRTAGPAADGTLVACAWLHRRRIGSAAGDFNVGGIGNVCSHPAARGIGAAAATLRAVQAYLTGAAALDFGLLFCGPAVAGFYQALGWQPVTNARRLTGSNGEAAADDDCLRLIYPARRSRSEWPAGEIDLRGSEW